MNRIEVRLVPWKVGGVALFLLAVCLLVGMNALSDVASPEAFAEALARAEQRRKTAPIEVIRNRFGYAAFSAVITGFLALLSAAGFAMAVTARRPAVTIDGDRVERTTPWGRTAYRLPKGALLTAVGKGLSIEPPATIVTVEGYRAGTLGKEVKLIPMTWWLADASVGDLQARLARLARTRS